MLQEHKELLLKDLCARLPYGVICEDGYGNVLELHSIDKPNTVIFKCSDNTFGTSDLDKCKPYLFPLSSMTEEQSKIYHELIGGMFGTGVLINLDCLIDFFNRNHLDWRGLIPMGLANDATRLNIY